MGNNLIELDYDDLVLMFQEKKISLVEFIEANPDLYDDWNEWIKNNDKKKNDISAKEYIDYIEQEVKVHI